MSPRNARLFLLLALLAFASGCVGTMVPTRRTNSALDFLYPQGITTAQPAREVVLKMPLRVGLAFAPNRANAADPITEEQKQKLLTSVADAFREHQAIGHLEVVPTTYLQPAGSFANLDQIRASLGLDLMVLVSYDQAQFTESTRASWTYLTVVGPLLIEGEKNDTRTVMDAVVYDISSRALLFRAAGESAVGGRSSPLNVERKRRTMASAGFDKATDSLIANLKTALARFEEQAKSGTVQGPGTPAVAMYNAEGQRIASGSGGGALGAPEWIAAALLGMALLAGRITRSMRGALVVATLAFLGTPALQAQWKTDGAPVPDTSWRKSDGDFGAMLVLTDRPEEFFAAWETESPGVAMSETVSAKRGLPIVGVVLFTGCAPDREGLCNSTVTYSVLKPDGTPYGEQQKAELWTGKRPPRKNEIQLSVGNMGIVLEPGDPLGTYVMRAEVHDLVSKKTLRLERPFAGVER